MSALTFTTHFLRCLFKELGSDARLDENGVDPMAEMPGIINNSDFAREYLLYNVSRKRDVYTKENVPSSVLRTSLNKWADSEHSCRVVNLHQRFYSPLGDDASLFRKLDQLTKAHVSRILCDRWPDYSTPDYTSGASNHLPRRYSAAAAKWIGYALPGRNQSVVPSAIPHLIAVLDENPAYAKRLHQKRWKLQCDTYVEPTQLTGEALGFFQTTVGACTARLDYVSKDFETVRMIVPTGEGTLLCQSLFGKTIRLALADEGVDLQDQSINREWAEIGSLTGMIATVDLSSASDTISQYTVKKYLPARWYTWLDETRDISVRVGDTFHKLEKFASMGNGYCFELESLLFYAMALACCDVLEEDTSFVNVYGDDIIIPSRVHELLSRFFLYNGFFLNGKKTFSGPQGFRESCGGHYYKGHDVTPFYVKKDIDTTADCFHIFNQLSEWCSRVGIPAPKSLQMLVDRIPPKERVLVPSTFGTKAGLHYYVEGIRLPVTKWSAKYQRHITLQRVMVARSVDSTERWCGKTLLMQWFIGASQPREKLVESVRFLGYDLPFLIEEASSRVKIKTPNTTSYEWRTTSG